MGFFRKKRPTLDESASGERSTSEHATVAAPAPVKAKPAQPPPPKPPTYGIDDAIALMRDLPLGEENVALVVNVIKRTLESTRVDVAAIIEDGTTKQHQMENQVKTLEREIAALQTELVKRRDEIAAREADHEETRVVREELVASVSLGTEAPKLEPTKAKTAAKAKPAKAKANAKPAQRGAAASAKSDGGAIRGVGDGVVDASAIDEGWVEDTDVPLMVDTATATRRPDAAKPNAS